MHGPWRRSRALELAAGPCWSGQRQARCGARCLPQATPSGASPSDRPSGSECRASRSKRAPNPQLGRFATDRRFLAQRPAQVQAPRPRWRCKIPSARRPLARLQRPRERELPGHPPPRVQRQPSWRTRLSRRQRAARACRGRWHPSLSPSPRLRPRCRRQACRPLAPLPHREPRLSRRVSGPPQPALRMQPRPSRPRNQSPRLVQLHHRLAASSRVAGLRGRRPAPQVPPSTQLRLLERSRPLSLAWPRQRRSQSPSLRRLTAAHCRRP